MTYLLHYAVFYMLILHLGQKYIIFDGLSFSCGKHPYANFTIKLKKYMLNPFSLFSGPEEAI